MGAVTAGCFASLGHDVVGVDVDEAKARALCDGRTAHAEPGLEALLRAAVAEARLRTTADIAEAVEATDMSLICVGTPAANDGAVDLSQVVSASRDIGAALRHKSRRHTVVVRSTMLPGAIRGAVASTIETMSGKRIGTDIGLATVPEFLRAGSAVADFFKPAQIVIGAVDETSAAEAASVFAAVDGRVSVTSLETAEMVKIVSNMWHGLKVVFANEIGALCDGLSVDGGEVMRVFASDAKFNLSQSYLTPGFAFGGPCLGKDIRALVHRARGLSLDLPVLFGVLPSNERRIDRAVARILARGKRKIAMLGLAFKPETGILKDSPYLTLALRLIDSGADLLIFDPHLDAAESREGHDSRISAALVPSLELALGHGELVLRATPHRTFEGVEKMLTPDQTLIDVNAQSDGAESWAGRNMDIPSAGR